MDEEYHDPKPLKIPDLIGFWILGLCNNFGYVVMLTAAFDILEEKHIEERPLRADERHCNPLSTGAILLADILPSLIIKLLSPFFPQYSTIRIVITCILAAIGILLAGFGSEIDDKTMVVWGVIMTSLSSGIGESSILAYMAHFNKNVVSTWSSGTGGAGIFGAAMYASLTQAGISIRDSMLIMLMVPFLMAVGYFVIITKPVRETKTDTKPHDLAHCKILYKNLVNIIKKALTLWNYIIPLALVYFFEYFINQALYELVQFDEFILEHHSQYRWLQVGYQVGVFISRSSVNLIYVSKLWLYPVLQFLNVCVFLSEVLIYYFPTYWMVLGFAVYEGLLGGGGYVNTYSKIHRSHADPIEREFALGTVSVADELGISLAGILALPVHNAICALSKPVRKAKRTQRWL